MKTLYEIHLADEAAANELVDLTSAPEFASSLKKETEAAMQEAGATGFSMTAPQLAEPTVVLPVGHGKTTNGQTTLVVSCSASAEDANSSSALVAWLLVAFLAAACCASLFYTAKLKSLLQQREADLLNAIMRGTTSTPTIDPPKPRTFEVPKKTKTKTGVDPDHVALRVVGTPSNDLRMGRGAKVVEGTTASRE